MRRFPAAILAIVMSVSTVVLVAGRLDQRGAAADRTQANARSRSLHPSPATATRNSVNIPPAAPTVVLYGDSLAAESQDHFLAALGAAGITDVHTRTFGGTAICDWLDLMRADAITWHPTAVVIEFSGNAFTACMRDAAGNALAGLPYYAKYADDATEVLRIFGTVDARVYLAGAPINQRAAQAHDPNAGRLNAIYASLAEVDPLSEYLNAGASVLNNGHWTKTLPCLAGEPCTGGTDATGTPVNIVRAPDGGHFCPAAPAAVRGVTGACPVWSSGAYRYGTALAAPVIHDYQDHSP
jgi:hypothetical protein